MMKYCISYIPPIFYWQKKNENGAIKWSQRPWSFYFPTQNIIYNDVSHYGDVNSEIEVFTQLPSCAYQKWSKLYSAMYPVYFSFWAVLLRFLCWGGILSYLFSTKWLRKMSKKKTPWSFKAYTVRFPVVTKWNFNQMNQRNFNQIQKWARIWRL